LKGFCAKAYANRAIAETIMKITPAWMMILSSGFCDFAMNLKEIITIIFRIREWRDVCQEYSN